MHITPNPSSVLHHRLFRLAAVVSAVAASTTAVMLAPTSASAAPRNTRVAPRPTTPISNAPSPLAPQPIVVCEAVADYVSLFSFVNDYVPEEIEPEEPTTTLDLPPDVSYIYRFSYLLNGVPVWGGDGYGYFDIPFVRSSAYQAHANTVIPMDCSQPDHVLLQVKAERIDRWNRSTVVFEYSRQTILSQLYLVVSAGTDIGSIGFDANDHNFRVLSRVVGWR
jgi:hypothetical protein